VLGLTMKKLPLLHVYPNREPEDMYRIVGNKNALLELSNRLKHAATNGFDFGSTYTADGHETTVLVVREDDADVWEYMESPYTDPVFSEQRQAYISVDSLEHVENFKKIKKSKTF
tara:strand:- start:3073 stop:3417 length:345 start_codon:yes stop_codon:yes gene_type:complete